MIDIGAGLLGNTKPQRTLARVAQFLVLLTVIVACRPPLTLERTKELVSKEFARQPGTFAIAFLDLSTGEEILLREDESFHAASTMKTPVMIEVFKQSLAGTISLSDSMEIRNDFTSIADGSAYQLKPQGDSEQELYSWIGKRRTVSDLMTRMITQSSNLATNLLIERVGAVNVMRTMRELGALRIEVLRGVEDSVAFGLGMNNTTTARDLMIIFQNMAKGNTVDQKSSDDMIAILLAQTFNDIIPAKLPNDVKVAHKTGSFTGVHHDSGIVFLPDGRKYVLVILSKDLVDDRAATRRLAKVSELVYRHVVSVR